MLPRRVVLGLTPLDREVVLSLRWSTALAAALAAACTSLAPAAAVAGSACGPSGYAYAGIQPAQAGYGVSVRLTSLASPVVQSGHVAGWVGVGGPGQGPGGSDLWIQVGLNSLPGTATTTLYYEVMRPGLGQTYAEVATGVPNGRSLRLAVLETAATPGAWRVWVNGRPVTPAIMLGSHGALSPMAMGESWDGGRPACNRYRYRFDNVSVASAPGGSWLPARDATVLQDPGYKVVKRAPASFEAGAVGALAATPAPPPVAASKGNVAAPARAISASSPLRKGALPAPTLEALVAATALPANA